MGSVARARESIWFGPYEVASQVFITTPLSFALVNLKPLLPGHVLVCPRRPLARLLDLTPAEASDLMTTVQQTQRVLAKAYLAGKGGDFTVAVQDGPLAGQTVPHLHVHVIPRQGEDGGDEIYGRLAGEEGNVGGALWDVQRPVPGGGMAAIEDADRRARGPEEMQAEAERYRVLLKEL
ncbi:hypothetical protein CDD82_3222 [Ophiocordyceps australis]|uniref:Bis(5'-adenosyl)-triphosphatase n=1 Tax=Ophiocordyceps australis TaxID=1399860 RepID=A0A2C5ZMD0_9HYPO|nr:hypothetical protein CDD82_3222 [Ophiocordyceps australis]